MQYNFILIRTDKGRKYANKILNSVKWINEHKYPQHTFRTTDITISDFIESYEDGMFSDNPRNSYQPNNTIIHARCANPRTKWTEYLKELQDRGFRVVNSVDTIELTSNKLACSLHLQGKVNHPKSWEYSKRTNWQDFAELLDEINNSLDNPKYIIAKPLTSLEQGANVKKIEIDFCDSVEDVQAIKKEVDSVPGNKIVIQEFIPYTKLHRVIVIGGKALPYTFVDDANDPRKTDWKVSCCLNRTTMRLNENAPRELLELAEKTQVAVGGVINFIDIFEYTETSPGGVFYRTAYTNAEINTACSLNIHERLAKSAGRRDWNIHYRIAKQLVKELLG